MYKPNLINLIEQLFYSVLNSESNNNISNDFFCKLIFNLF